MLAPSCSLLSSRRRTTGPYRRFYAKMQWRFQVRHRRNSKRRRAHQALLTISVRRSMCQALDSRRADRVTQRNLYISQDALLEFLRNLTFSHNIPSQRNTLPSEPGYMERPSSSMHSTPRIIYDAKEARHARFVREGPPIISSGDVTSTPSWWLSICELIGRARG